MNPDTAYLKNKAQIDRLADRVKWAVRNWMEDSWGQGLYWYINSGYRTYAQQLALYAKGRWTKGPIVTWTLNSDHTKGLAVDLTLLNGTYEEAEDTARVYGIRRVPELLVKGDLGHFSLTNAAPEPYPPIIAPQARIAGLRRRLENTKDADTRRIAEAVLRRLEARVERHGKGV